MNFCLMRCVPSRERRWLPLLVSAVWFCAGTPVFAEGWYSNAWQFRQKITVASNLVTGSHSNFPVLISITNANPVFSKALTNGGDIFFAGADGTTPLSFEKELYATNGPSLVYWVNIPNLSSNADTKIFMYYGSVVPYTNNQPWNVWDNDYRMVLHLDETAQPNYDSTAYTNHANYQYYPIGSFDATGKVDGADWFNGNLHDLKAAAAASLNLTNAITMSCWLKYDTCVTTNFYGLLQLTGTYMRKEDSGAFRYIFTGLSASSIYSTTKPESNTWYHVVGTYDGTAIRAYVNGVQENSIASTGVLNQHTDATYIARWSNKYHNGVMDEVRVSSVARDAGWIRTSYDNQNDPAAFLSFDAEKQMPFPGTVVTIR